MTTHTTKVTVDEICRRVSADFDFLFEGVSTFSVPEIDIPQDYGIGLIVGPSGSGKSCILSSIQDQHGAVEWDKDKAVCSHFENYEQARDRLQAAGLNSIPSWLRPYRVLSTGERFRADIARLLRDNACIDEFTSTVDRNTAKSCSMSVSRYVKGAGLRNITLASCHYDIVDWLEPDWVFDTLTKRMTARGWKRPSIELEILPCSSQVWPVFAPHHYLSESLNKSARCWMALWEGTLVGFASAIAFPNGNFSNGWRGHRTVVLPDFQGMGIGVRLSDAIARIHTEAGGRYFSKTVHPRMGEYREQSPLWKPTSKNRKSRQDYDMRHITKEDKHKMKHAHRVAYSHEFVGGCAQ